MYFQSGGDGDRALGKAAQDRDRKEKWQHQGLLSARCFIKTVCVYTCARTRTLVCKYIHMSVSVSGGQKRAPGHLKLEWV